ncbi:MAG: hypothetical protein KJO07_17250 [Deltaproteobacteria bacterium]|nr:hypothetical protein [Deltaproteobacteria bacterium]
MMRLRLALIALLGSCWISCSVSSDVSRELGARCDDMDDCDDRCLPPSDFPGGFCSTSCESNGDCPSDASCIDVEGGVCLFRCVDSPDCGFLGAGWTCAAAQLRGEAEEVMACTPVP